MNKVLHLESVIYIEKTQSLLTAKQISDTHVHEDVNGFKINLFVFINIYMLLACFTNTNLNSILDWCNTGGKGYLNTRSINRFIPIQ